MCQNEGGPWKRVEKVLEYHELNSDHSSDGTDHDQLCEAKAKCGAKNYNLKWSVFAFCVQTPLVKPKKSSMCEKNKS